jgi:hypothetical protein
MVEAHKVAEARVMPGLSLKTLCLLASLILADGLLAGCGASGATPSHPALAMAPMDGMPAEVQAAPLAVQEAYQFAVANPEVLSEIPCYCGCGGLGHKSNYDCYVDSVDGSGGFTYDPHALNCAICVDITHDTMRSLRAGHTLAEARAHVDSTFARRGPSNMP